MDYEVDSEDEWEEEPEDGEQLSVRPPCLLPTHPAPRYHKCAHLQLLV
jgi:Chromatin assembly factor 1 subunit A